MPSFSQDDIVVARVVNEDEKFLLVEIPKDDEHVFHLEEGETGSNRFYTMLFTQFKDGEPTFEKPW